MVEIKNSVINKSIVLDGVGDFILNEEDLGVIEGTHSTSKALGQNGTYLNNTVLESRDIPIIGSILANNEYEMENKKKNLIDIVNPLNDLMLIRESYKIEGRPTATVKFSSSYKENNDYLCKFMFTLFCSNPFWSDIKDTKVDIALWKGSFHFPLSIPKGKNIIMGYREPSLIVNIKNSGSIETGMIIEFRAKGTLKNPSLFNVNTQEWLKLEKEMVFGEIIRINTNFGKKRVEKYINGVTSNAFNYIKRGSKFLQLHVGDNLFRYDADENINNLEVAIYHNNYYLGVI